MKLIRNIHNFNQAPRKCVLTIGNFDGVHRGHQSLLKELWKEGKIRSLPVVLIIFEPQPSELFASKNTYMSTRLTYLREKLYYLSQQDVDYVLCIRFNWRFAALTATNFVDNLLVKHLGVCFLAVGDDFRFGAGRQGDFLLLKQAGLKYGFDVISMKTFCESGLRISSTAIRQALSEDKLEIAENMLGHPFTVSGRVVHGNGLGRTIGFPTANVPLRYRVFPVNGVYIVEVIGLSITPLPGIANISLRKTTTGVFQQLEVHVLDVIIDLYGHHISVALRKKIRNEQKFMSLNALKLQISRDKLIARSFFKLSNLI